MSPTPKVVSDVGSGQVSGELSGSEATGLMPSGPERGERKVILDLCGGTGEWSRWYRLAGYDVRLVTLPDRDVRDYEPPAGVHGILAAPPCTDFAVSGARWWALKGEPDLSVVNACLELVEECSPAWWCLENPVGRLKNYIGGWVHAFDPCDYGDPYTKKTCLWGSFQMPTKKPVVPTEGSKMHRLPESPKRAVLRSVTPPGFARAFFEANP
jgi:hypothetical protein